MSKARWFTGLLCGSCPSLGTNCSQNSCDTLSQMILGWVIVVFKLVPCDFVLHNREIDVRCDIFYKTCFCIHYSFIAFNALVKVNLLMSLPK